MYVTADSTDVELKHIARRISYAIGIKDEFFLHYLALERRVLQLEESVADMGALRARLERLEAGHSPHLSKVERRGADVKYSNEWVSIDNK